MLTLVDDYNVADIENLADIQAKRYRFKYATLHVDFTVPVYIPDYDPDAGESLYEDPFVDGKRTSGSFTRTVTRAQYGGSSCLVCTRNIL